MNEKMQLLFQFMASAAWFTSVIVYGSYELGDILQLTAASMWIAANIVSFVSLNAEHV